MPRKTPLQITCKYCSKTFLSLTVKIFCDSSCAASYNNNQRKIQGWSLSEESKQKIRFTHRQKYKHIKKPPKKRKSVKKDLTPRRLASSSNKYWLIKLTSCKNCNKLFWISRHWNRYTCSDNCKNQIMQKTEADGGNYHI